MLNLYEEKAWGIPKSSLWSSSQGASHLLTIDDPRLMTRCSQVAKVRVSGSSPWLGLPIPTAVSDKKNSSDDLWCGIENHFPGGGAQCLITDHLQYLVHSPGECPQSIKGSNIGGNYRISLGMFATRDFNTGDLLSTRGVPRIPVVVLTEEGKLDEQASKIILYQAEKVGSGQRMYIPYRPCISAA